MLPILYNLLFPLVFLLLLPGYLLRMVRRGNYRQNFRQRLGFFSAEMAQRLQASPGAVWLQAVSVGEMLVALKLLAALRAREPALPLVISTTTTTGYALAVGRVPDDVPVIYTPIDVRSAVRRTFDRLKPAQLVIVDGGLWPNQLWEARRRGVPTALVNARLSPRSERRFIRFGRMAQVMFRELGLVGVPYPEDRERWMRLGAPVERVRHTGSVKFDDAPVTEQPSSRRATPGAEDSPRGFLRRIGVPEGAPILLAASTHPGEERMIAEMFIRLRTRFPTLFLIVVPRHVERSSQVKAALENLGCRVVLRTVEPSAAVPPEVLLVDTTGELPDWYTTATLAFIGKSLNAIGGQNPAEAVVAGVPVLFGPHMENFQELTSRLLSAEAVAQVGDLVGLEQLCGDLLEDRGRRRRMAQAARQVIAVHQGAGGRTADLLLAQLGKMPCQIGDFP